MNEKNLDYLKNSLKYLGFGEKLNTVLESAMHQGLPKFTISLNNTVENQSKENAKDHIRYDLNFSKSKESDMYFLNDYKGALQKPNEPLREQTFSLSINNWITAKEAYNLLSGRSVNKDLNTKEKDEKVNVWMKLDMDVKDARGYHPQRSFFPNYGYDFEATLSKYPIVDLSSPEKKEQLLASLKKGDLISSELLLDGKKMPVFIAANPEMKSMDIYDKQFKPIRDYDIWPEQSSKKENAQEVPSGPAEEVKKTKGRKSSAVAEAMPWEADSSKKVTHSVGR